jgi:hypothetical protein
MWGELRLSLEKKCIMNKYGGPPRGLALKSNT